MSKKVKQISNLKKNAKIRHDKMLKTIPLPLETEQ